MPTIAFVCIGAAGHVFPTLPVVHELTARGEEVVYFVPERYRAHVEAAGAIFRPYGSTMLVKERARPRRRDLDAILASAPGRLAEDIAAATPQLIEELSANRPQALVCDTYAFAGRIAGAHLGIATARSNPTYILSERLNYYRDAESGQELSSRAALDRYDQLAAPVFERYRMPYQSFMDLRTRRAELDVVYIASAFHPGAGELGEGAVLVGPSILPGARRPASPIDLPAAPSGPLIYVSLGTISSYDPTFFYLCMEALAPLSAQVVMQVNDHLAQRIADDLPPNVVALADVEQLDLLGRADLFITHAGMGSAMEALYYGAPMLAIPQSSEQRMTARRIEELGAGLSLKREEISIGSLRRAALDLLREPSYRRRARELGEAAKRDGGYLRACDHIQAFARRARAMQSERR